MREGSRQHWMFTTGVAIAATLIMVTSVVTLSEVALAQDIEQEVRPAGVINEIDDTLSATLADCADVVSLAPGELSVVDDGHTAFVIDSEQSEARYVVDEELAGVGANTAVGRTNAFIGQIIVDGEMRPEPCSRFDVDLRALLSDSSRRDNYLRGATLQSDQFPVATFVVLSVEGLEGALTDEEQTFTLIGNLIFRGETRLVAWESTVAVTDGSLTGTAFTEFDMEAFQIQKPIVGSVISIDDTIRLEVDIVAIEG